MMKRHYIAILALVAVGFVAIAAQSTTKGAGNAVQPTRVASLSSDERADRDKQARRDLEQLAGSLRWSARFPAQLPAGYTYDRVIWHSDHPELGFQIFISDATGATNRAIHLMEQPLTPELMTNPRNPLVVFKSVVRPLTLPNGTWQTMQQDHQPWQGEWIFMIQSQGLQIQVEGMAPKALLASFAGSL
jgi:predicted small secreted protein